MKLYICDTLGSESHRQFREVGKYWEKDQHIVGVGLFVGFVDNNKNIEQYQPYK